MTQYKKYLFIALLVLGIDLAALFPIWFLTTIWDCPLAIAGFILAVVQVPTLVGLSLIFFVWKKFEVREAPKEA